MDESPKLPFSTGLASSTAKERNKRIRELKRENKKDTRKNLGIICL